jgi:hypothetical protein
MAMKKPQKHKHSRMVMSSNIWEQARQQYDNPPQEPQQIAKNVQPSQAESVEKKPEQPQEEPKKIYENIKPGALPFVPKTAPEKQPSKLSNNAAPNAFDIAQKIYTGTENEAWAENIKRNTERTGARIAETVVGLPGDIMQLGNAAGGWIDKKLPSFMQRGEPDFIREMLQKGALSLPTQQSLQAQTEQNTEGYLSPRGPGEEFSDEVTKTVTGLLMGSWRAPIQMATNIPRVWQPIVSMSRKLGTAMIAESAKQGVKELGAGPVGQEATKLASLLILGATLPRVTGEVNPTVYASNLFQARDNLIRGVMVTPTGLEHDLQHFINTSLRVGSTPAKREVLPIAEKFLQDIRGRSVPMETMTELYNDINANRAAAMSAPMTRGDTRRARRLWGEIANMWNQTLEGYLGTIGPDALNLHRAGNQAWSGLAQAGVSSNFIMNKIEGVPLKTGVASLFGGGIWHNPSAVGITMAGAAAGAAGIKSTELIYRFLTNPTLRHYYNQVLMGSIRENGPATIHAIKKLDQAYFKELQDPNSSVYWPLPGQPRKEEPQQKKPQGKAVKS